MQLYMQWPKVPLAARSKGESAAARLLGLRVQIHQDYRCLSLVFGLCFQVEISATMRPLVQRSPSEFGVSEFDLETQTMRRPRSTRTVESLKKIQAQANH